MLQESHDQDPALAAGRRAAVRPIVDCGACRRTRACRARRSRRDAGCSGGDEDRGGRRHGLEAPGLCERDPDLDQRLWRRGPQGRRHRGHTRSRQTRARLHLRRLRLRHADLHAARRRLRRFELRRNFDRRRLCRRGQPRLSGHDQGAGSRPAPRRDPQGSAGHAVRPQLDRRHDQLRAERTDAVLHGWRRGRLRQLRPFRRRGLRERADHGQLARPLRGEHGQLDRRLAEQPDAARRHARQAEQAGRTRHSRLAAARRLQLALHAVRLARWQ